MGSVHHPHWVLILQSVERTVDNAVRNGGIVAAALEARRLVRTYPEAAMSEADIVAEFVRVGAERGALIDIDRAADGMSPAVEAGRSSVASVATLARQPGVIRERIWERIRVGAGDPIVIDAGMFAREVLAEFPGSGLAEKQLVLEFRRIRRVSRRRPAEAVPSEE